MGAFSVITNLLVDLRFQLYFSGGQYSDEDMESVDAILRFDPGTLAWAQVGVMAEGRAYHGMSVVRARDIQDYCY